MNESIDQQIARLARELAVREKIDLGAATIRIFVEQPDLAQEWLRHISDSVSRP